MTRDFEDYEQKRPHLLNFLQTVTNGLVLFTGRAADTEEQKNQLLRECYDLANRELHTIEEWHKMDCLIRRGEHAHIFWKGNEPQLLYADNQIIRRQLTLF